MDDAPDKSADSAEAEAPAVTDAPAATADAPAADTQSQPQPQPEPQTQDAAPGPEPAASDPGQTVADAAKKAAKRFSDLPVRIVSGAVYLVVFIACLLIGKWTTMALIAVLAAIGCWEFYRMERRVGRQTIDVVGIFAAALYPVAALVGGRTLMLGLTFLLIIVLLCCYVFNPRLEMSDMAITLFGPLYTGLMLSSFVLIRCGMPGLAGSAVLLGIFLSVCVSDSAAYLVGSRFGRHKLVPKISPKKSWEGFVGGIVGAIVVWLVVSLIHTVDVNLWQAAVIGLVTGVVGLLGDLAESRIKRSVGVKDSGNIMPGHGGILDRVDAMILVSFITYLLLVLMGVV